MLRLVLTLLAALAAPSFVAAQPGTGDWWTPAARPAIAQPGSWSALDILVDRHVLAEILCRAPVEVCTPPVVHDAQPLVLHIPMPDGAIERFAIFNSPIMAPALAARFPLISTFGGRGIDDATALIRLSLSPEGLTARILHARGSVSILPPASASDSAHRVRWDNQPGPQRPRWRCGVTQDQDPLPRPDGPQPDGPEPIIGPSLRTLRLAVATSGEFTAFHGGTVDGSMAAVVSLVNRVNLIYERDLAVRFILVEHNDWLLFTDPDTDPYTNGYDDQMAVENQPVVDGLLGSDAYDVGHVLGVGDGGVAAQAGACTPDRKAQGASNADPPVGDALAVDVLCHELGHQLGATHCFNSCERWQGGSFASAFEPGSGSTIMAYAGLCPTDNIQFNSDPYFHGISIRQISTWLDASPCVQRTDAPNHAPVVSAGPGHTLPRLTPFLLTGSATDSDGDALTYCWEQMDLGPARPLGSQDNGSAPLARSLPPTVDPSRAITGAAGRSEILPMYARQMRWRLTARDNHPGSGGVAGAEVVHRFVDTAGPFAVLSPGPGESFGGAALVRWSVAGTDLPPISTTQVNILLSIDGGQSFPIVLAQAVPNSGEHVVVFPPNVSSEPDGARLRLGALGNIFFADSGAFTLQASSPLPRLISAGSPVVSDSAPGGNANGSIEPGESGLRLSVPIALAGSSPAVDITASLVSQSPTVIVTTGLSTYPALGSTGAASLGAPFIIAVSPLHPCGQPISLLFTASAALGPPLVVPITLPTGSPAATGRSWAVPYLGEPKAIPGSPSSLTINFDASAIDPQSLVGSIAFRFDGSECTSEAHSSTVGLSHTWLGDLRITLVSPSGAAAVLLDRPGIGPYGSAANNLCCTRLSDDGPWPLIDAITDTAGPCTGNFHPHQSFGAFAEQPARGQWRLFIEDLRPDADEGIFYAATLIITELLAPACAPAGGLCPADVTGIGGPPASPDGLVTGDDFNAFIAAFASADPLADITGIGGPPAVPDGLITGDDFNAFISAFAAGCP